MKRSTSAVLLFVLVVSSFVPTFAQKARATRADMPTSAGFAEFERTAVYTDGFGVYLGWEMRSETGNMGFNIFRVGRAGLEQINTALIPGSAMTSSQPVLRGSKYEFFDPQGRVNSSYVIRSYALDGRQQSTNALSAKLTKNFEAATGRAKSYFTAAPRANSSLRNTALSLPAELENIVRTAALEPNLAAQKYIASLPGAKIAVRKDGVYMVTRAELQNAGFDVNTNPVTWRLFMEGNEQAIIVEPTGQYIEFYGKALDTRESDTRIYYLVNDGIEGKRMLPKILRPLGGNAVTNNYKVRSTTKERSQYSSKIKNGDTENYWGRSVFNSPASTVPFTVTGIDQSAATVSINIKMQGIFGGIHTVNAALNGNPLGQITGVDLVPFAAEFTVPTSFLNEGANSLSLNTSLSSDAVFFDTVSVNFARRYQADADVAGFFTPGYRRADVKGFTTPNVTLFDITYDGNTQLVTNPVIEQEGSGFTLKLPSDRPAVFYAVENGALLHSPAVTYNVPTAYSSSSTPTDMIIISHSAPDFLAAAEAWAEYRRSAVGGGLSVKVIDVADIYDEFNYGVMSAASINAFLRYADNNWGSRYVLLLGDGSYDPRNYEGWGYNDLIPTAMVDLIFEETGSDDALADFDSDGLADIPIGRVPARNAFSITSALEKVKIYESAGNRSLNRGVVLAYDIPNDYDFEAMSNAIGFQLPEGTPKQLVSRGLQFPNQNTPDPDGQANLLAALNTGPIFANYSGHGSAGLWGSSGFFGSANVPQLTNGRRPTIYTMLTCFNGYFLRPRAEDDSLSEVLLKQNVGGAVATWASSTETTPAAQGVMAERFYNRAGLGTIPRLGDLVRDAKTPIAGSDVGYSWVLIGDPALLVR